MVARKFHPFGLPINRDRDNLNDLRDAVQNYLRELDNPVPDHVMKAETLRVLRIVLEETEPRKWIGGPL